MGLWGFVCCGGLIIVVIALVLKIHMIQVSVDEIASEFADILSQDTNALIDISGNDRHVRAFAKSINNELRLLRCERRKYQQGDVELKEAVTNISHDLRTPLTAICGYLELLETEEKSADAERYIKYIENRTEAMKRLTEELFRYSVIVSEKEENREKLLVNDVLEESLVSFYGAMTQRNIVPNISITEKEVERYISRSALSRVFENIISNAMKYSEGDFSVKLEENGTITFSNRAAKLSPVDVGKLFDRFFTVESGRNSTGLGLSIAKILTERMNGTVTADYREKRLIITVKI